MEVRGSLRVMLRRWPVIVVGLLVLAVGMIGITKATRTQSQATLTVLLTGPASQIQRPTWPRHRIPCSLMRPRWTSRPRITAISVASSRVADALAKRGLTATYTVTPAVQYGTSSMTIVSRSFDPDIAVRTAQAVSDAIQSDLHDRQLSLGIPTTQVVGALPIGLPQITHFNKNKFRLLMAAGAAGVGLIVIAVFAVEAGSPWLRRRDRQASSTTKHRRGTLATLRHRWYLTVIGLCIVGIAVIATVKHSRPIFRADSALLVLPPHLPVNPALPLSLQGSQNPLLSFDSSVNTTTQAATIAVMDPASKRLLAQRGAQGDYVITNWEQGASPVDTTGDPTPVVQISATADSPAAALRTADLVTQAFGSEMEDIQTSLGAPADTHIRPQTVTKPQAYVIATSKTRLLASIALFGLGLMIVAILLADRALQRLSASGRTRTRAEDSVEAAEPRPVNLAWASVRTNSQDDALDPARQPALTGTPQGEAPPS